jgi:hypothetical protein
MAIAQITTDLVGPQMDKGGQSDPAFAGRGAPSAAPIDLNLAACPTWPRLQFALAEAISVPIK